MEERRKTGAAFLSPRISLDTRQDVWFGAKPRQAGPPRASNQGGRRRGRTETTELRAVKLGAGPKTRRALLLAVSQMADAVVCELSGHTWVKAVDLLFRRRCAVSSGSPAEAQSGRALQSTSGFQLTVSPRQQRSKLTDECASAPSFWAVRMTLDQVVHEWGKRLTGEAQRRRRALETPGQAAKAKSEGTKVIGTGTDSVEGFYRGNMDVDSRSSTLPESLNQVLPDGRLTRPSRCEQLP